MSAVRAMRGARGCLSVVAARRAPPFGSDFGRQWCLCTKTARPTRFSTRKAVQGGAEGAWGLGSECCGQALRWRRVCAPVLRRQRCACERLTSRGVRGRVGFRFGRPVFWAGAGAEGLRRWPASLLQTALGAEAGPAPARGGAAAAHRACYSTPSTRCPDIVLSGRFDLSLDFRSESGPRRRGRLCPRPRVSEHQREQYIPRRLVKIIIFMTGAWGVRPRPDGTAPGVRRAAAPLAGAGLGSAPRAVCRRLPGHRRRPSAPAPAQKTGLPKRKPTLPLTPREVGLSHAHLCRRKTGAQTRRHRNA